MPAYEGGDVDPPAPVVRARIIGPADSQADVPLLIDSGADVSAIPRSAANAVGADIVRSRAAIQLVTGQEIRSDQADVAVEFLRFRFRGTFLVLDSTHGIVGRNILNGLQLTLDGGHLEWHAD